MYALEWEAGAKWLLQSFLIWSSGLASGGLGVGNQQLVIVGEKQGVVLATVARIL